MMMMMMNLHVALNLSYKNLLNICFVLVTTVLFLFSGWRH